MKKGFNVLITCSNIHVAGMIDCLKNNYDEADVKVYCTNSNKADLPSEEDCDGTFAVPSVNDELYFPCIKRLCKRLKIDVVIPATSIDLEAMAEHKDEFLKYGIYISTSSVQSLKIANDKIALHSMFSKYMPREIVAKSSKEMYNFYLNGGKKICCKVANMCGGRGFAVVDDDKYLDVDLFHRYGEKHYISLDMLCDIVDNADNDVIVQEYKDGLDYSVSVLADHGRITHICGYVGYVMEFGAMMYAEVKHNERAFEIAEDVCNKLKLDGNACFDFIIGEGGEVTLLEVNPRVNASLSLVSKAGCNMYYLRCKQLLGLDYENEQQSIQEGLKMKKYYGTRYFV